MSVNPEFQIEFLGNLQRLLAEGSFVATYKFALLLALADAAVEHGEDSDEELELATKQISEHVIRYYWRQTIPYVPKQDPAQGQVLRQNTGIQAAIIRRIVEARHEIDESLASAMRKTAKWKSLLSEVDRTIRTMPLWKLQTVGNLKFDFLYENVGKGTSIKLKPGISFCLRRYYQLISDMVRGAWVRYIRKHNQDLLGTTTDLTEFLFGSERTSLSSYRPILADIQKGICFYCKRKMGDESGEVDHFVPWALYPHDLGHNFVLAHSTCNNSKSDHLASERFLDDWWQRNHNHNVTLTEQFTRLGLLHDLATSRRIAIWAYGRTFSVGGLTWDGKGVDMQRLGDNWQAKLGEAISG